MDFRNSMIAYILYFQNQADNAGRKWIESSEHYWYTLQLHYINEINEIKKTILDHEKSNPPK